MIDSSENSVPPERDPLVPIGDLSEVLARCSDPQLIRDFLVSLLTKKELLDIGSRWELVNMIAEGTSQRKISHSLGISLCKITRGSKELKRPDSPFLKMIKVYAGHKRRISEE